MAVNQFYDFYNIWFKEGNLGMPRPKVTYCKLPYVLKETLEVSESSTLTWALLIIFESAIFTASSPEWVVLYDEFFLF